MSQHESKLRYDSLVNNIQADNTDFAETRAYDPNRPSATGEYQGFYQRILRKKREAQEAIFEEPSKKIDLDAELQKLERIKDLRRSKMEEQRER